MLMTNNIMTINCYSEHQNTDLLLLIIISNEYGHVFGGYFATKLDRPDDGSKTSCKRDETAILFLLRSAKKGLDLPKIYYPVEGQNWNTIRYYPKAGPCFGDGLEIFIDDKCDKNKSSYSRPGYGFQMEHTNEMCGGNKKLRDNGIHWKYIVKEYEVFQIVD